MLRDVLQSAFIKRIASAIAVYPLCKRKFSTGLNAADANNDRLPGRSDISWFNHRPGFLLLLFFVMSMGMSSPANAIQTPCSAVGGLLDGNVTPVPPANIKIDANCRIQNYPGGLNTNFSFDNNDPNPYLVIFDNVFLTGQMSCNTVAGHKIWFTNNATTTLSAKCQSILIPVEKIDKQNPAGQTTATIGVPFTYIMTIPVLFDPATGGVVTSGSVNELGNIHVTDDLSLAATGADLTLLSVIAYDRDTNTPIPINNIGGSNLDFTLPDILANEQIIVEVTVVLNDTPANVAGNTFINTAKWEFSRLIDGQFFSPLPGENGITLPLTIAEPELVVTKTNPDTVLNVGILSTFTIDVQNNGGSEAWNVSLFDQFPDGATAGMCDYDPTSGAGITARVFDALGTTPVSPVLIQGVDFTATYRDASVNPPSTRCQLEIDMLSSAAVIGPTQRLIITYQSQLDVNTTAQGALLVNVAGAVEWFSDDPANNPRQYIRTISNGTPLISDHEDSFTITTALSGYVFHKTVENWTTGANPTLTAAPGDQLRYRLRLFNVDQNFTAINIFDQLSTTQFDLASFNMVTIPGTAEFTYSNVTGQLNIDGIGTTDLNLPIGNELIIEFDITLLSAPPLANGDIVLNQASLISNTVNALSDDPAGGIVPPGDPGDPTQVIIQAPGPLSKVNDQATATIGEQFTYTILVPATPVLVPLYDVRILDDLAASSADLRFVSASVVSGGSWSLTNTSGSATNLVIEDTVTGIDIPSLGQAEIRITVEMLNTSTNSNIPATPFNNTASYTYNRTNGINTSQVAGAGDTTADMNVVEPAQDVSKFGTLITAAPLSGGSIIEYVINIFNAGDSTAFNVNVVDNLPPELALDANFIATASIGGNPVLGFDPLPGPGALPGQWIWGQGNGDGTLDIPVGQTLVLTYHAQVQTSAAATFNNVAWIDWLSLENGNPSVRTGAGCPVFTAPDDYCETAIGNVFTIIDSNSLNKAAIADSWVTDGSTAGDKTVRIGDTVTYRLTLNLGEGTLNSVTVSDVLPAGMAFDSLLSISPPSTAGGFIYTLASQPVNGDTGTLVWDFGTVTNTPSGDGTPIDSIVIEYVATVLPNAGIAQLPTLSLDNTATLAYVDGAGIPVIAPLRLQATESVTLLQPVMTSVTKTESGAANTVANPLNVNVVTDVMQFQLESCNTTGLAPAYSVLLRDALATQLDESSLSAPVVTANSGVLAAADYIYTAPLAPGDPMLIELLVPLNPGECVTVDYNIGFYTTFPPNQTWSNNFFLDEYWSLPQTLFPGAGQLYAQVGPAQFFMTNIVGLAPISKLVTSPVSGEITIGEQAVYTITLPVVPIGGVINNVVVTDTLHPALEYIPVTAADVVDGIGNPVAFTDTSAGQNVILSIAQIPAGQQVVITLRARLANNAAANAGVSFSNVVSYTSNEFPGPTTATSAPLTIVEPLLAIAKSVAPTVPPIPGATLTYSVTLTASSGANFTDAFDLTVIDTLSAGLSYVPGTSQLNAAPINNPGIAGQTLTWDLSNNDIDVPEGSVATLTYDVLVGAVLPGSVLSNSASTQWTSLDGLLGDPPNPFERTGTGGLNDYFTGPVTTTLTTQSGALLKEVLPLTKTTVAVGEQFTYRITVPAIPQPTALNDVRVLDDLTFSTLDTVDMSFVSAVAVPPGAYVLTNTGTATSLVIEDLVNGIDIPAFGQAVIDITVVLNNTAINSSGKVFNNTANYTYNAALDPGLPDTSGPLTIIGADTMALAKTGPATMQVGLPDTFTIDVQNTGSGPAWDMTVTDVLPDLVLGGMCNTAPTNITVQMFTAGGVAIPPVLTAGTDYITSFIGCNLSVTMQSVAAAIDAGNRLIITYDAALDADSVGGDVMTNVAAATQWFSGDTSGAGATGQIRTFIGTLTDGTVLDPTDEQDAHSLTVQSPTIVFRKTVLNFTTGSTTDAQPGDVLQYTITAENISTIPLVDFSLVDELDALNVSPMFVAGSLTAITASSGDTSNSDPNGGVNGTGLVDVRNLNFAGIIGETVTVTFRATLAPVINSGTIVLNQAQLNVFGTLFGVSDDPNVNGPDDPTISGDEDPTQTLIISAPAWLLQKSSADITGDPADLQPGDTLRYTLTVKNIGDENSVNTLLTDQVPSNTAYVAGSTTLNTAAVADPGAGISPLSAGLLINAPEINVTGFMRADIDPTANNVATITFDVVVSPTVIAGTLISNQGFVTGNGAGSGAFPQQPSDDPTTAAADDPTIDIVGNVPFFDVLKTVAISNDVNGNGIVDPGDTLRYTITATNFGALPVTNVVLTDPVPASSQYVGNSTTLNGSAIADPAVNVSPLIAGIDISSSDLTPPLPGPGAGVLVPGQSAFIEFEVVVDPVIAGTVISNQGFVSSNELPTEPTDADGIDANGDQPTDVIVGSPPLLTVTKQVNVVGGGTALAGGELEYVIRVTNTGLVPVTNVIITDDLDLPVAGQMTYVANSGLINGLSAGVTAAGSILIADYSAVYGDLAVGAVAEFRFRVLLDAGLNIGDTVTNIADVSWNIPAITASATVDIAIGGTPGTANFNGRIWHDTDFDNIVDGGEALLQGWTVELYNNSVLLASALTDANGFYQFSGLVPNLPAGAPYEIRFTAPGATATTATLGQASSAFTNGPQRITDIFAASGASLQDLNLPRQVNGIVYDSVLRLPVPGVQLTMVNQTRSNQPVPASCFDDPVHASQVTLADGYYKFDLNFSDATRCARGDEYEIQVLPPANGYIGTTSAIIPPVVPVTGAALDVPNCPNNPAIDKILATAQHCENNVSAVQPGPSIAAGTAGTEYNLKFLFDDVAGTPFTDQIFNNHIPVDPELQAAVAISKVAGKLNVTRSDLVPYTITVNNTLPVPLQALNVIDNFPAGFKYVTGSARLDDVEVEPLINGRQLTWNNIDIAVAGQRVIKLLLIVGSGVGEGEYVNTAQVVNSLTNNPFSGVASATVRVIPDPTFDCTDIVGKVFNDKNNNSYQDQGETGIAGVQVATARGLRVTTDKHGRFHITCAIVANEVRGSNFIMKVDDRTLPSGYRITTENPRVQRATRGKMLKFNFGASIHRVVRLDLAGGVFEKGSTDLRPQWKSRIDMLITELQKDASILRLTYLAENESESEVEDRLDAIEDLISDRWQQLDCCYKLVIETEVFWRKGSSHAGREFVE